MLTKISEYWYYVHVMAIVTSHIFRAHDVRPYTVFRAHDVIATNRTVYITATNDAIAITINADNTCPVFISRLNHISIVFSIDAMVRLN